MMVVRTIRIAQGSKHASTITLICKFVACEKRIIVVELVMLETGGLISEVFELGLEEFVVFMNEVFRFGTVSAS